jgi:hypothetical protein
VDHYHLRPQLRGAAEIADARARRVHEYGRAHPGDLAAATDFISRCGGSTGTVAHRGLGG